jgi:hypothetical protein
MNRRAVLTLSVLLAAAVLPGCRRPKGDTASPSPAPPEPPPPGNQKLTDPNSFQVEMQDEGDRYAVFVTNNLTHDLSDARLTLEWTQTAFSSRARQLMDIPQWKSGDRYRWTNFGKREGASNLRITGTARTKEARPVNLDIDCPLAGFVPVQGAPDTGGARQKLRAGFSAVFTDSGNSYIVAVRNDMGVDLNQVRIWLEWDRSVGNGHVKAGTSFPLWAAGKSHSFGVSKTGGPRNFRLTGFVTTVGANPTAYELECQLGQP